MGASASPFSLVLPLTRRPPTRLFMIFTRFFDVPMLATISSRVYVLTTLPSSSSLLPFSSADSPSAALTGVPTLAGMKSPRRPPRRSPRRSLRRSPTAGSATSRSANTGERRFVTSFSTPFDSMKYASEGTSVRIYSTGEAQRASTMLNTPSVIAVRVTAEPLPASYSAAVLTVPNWSAARPLRRGRSAYS